MRNKKYPWKKYQQKWHKKFYSKKQNRLKKRKRDREYQRKKRARLKGYKTKEYRKYYKKNPEKVKAHRLLNIAIKNKTIQRLPCEVCGKEKVHAHHDDYNEPYKVRFLCSVHHKAVH